MTPTQTVGVIIGGIAFLLSVYWLLTGSKDPVPEQVNRIERKINSLTGEGNGRSETDELASPIKTAVAIGAVVAVVYILCKWQSQKR